MYVSLDSSPYVLCMTPLFVRQVTSESLPYKSQVQACRQMLVANKAPEQVLSTDHCLHLSRSGVFRR